MTAKTPTTNGAGPSAADYVSEYADTAISSSFTEALDIPEMSAVFDPNAEQQRRLEQYNTVRAQLNRPLDRELVKQRDGYGIDRKTGKTKVLNYLEHHSVTRLLNSIFGPGHWSIGETKITDYFDPSATDGIPRAVRVTKTLSFNDIPGFEYTVIEMTGYQVVQQPTTWENGKKVKLPFTWSAYEMALGNAEAKAFKRAAAQLGEALGLNLYSDELEPSSTEEAAPSTSSTPRAQQTSGNAEPTTTYGDDPAYCEDCGGEIRGYTNKQTRKTYTTDDLVAMSRKYASGRILCYNCRSK